MDHTFVLERVHKTHRGLPSSIATGGESNMIHYHLESSQDCRPTQLHLQSFQNNNKTDNNNVDWETAAAAVVVATVAGHQRGSSNVSGDPAQQCNSFVRAVSFKTKYRLSRGVQERRRVVVVVVEIKNIHQGVHAGSSSSSSTAAAVEAGEDSSSKVVSSTTTGSLTQSF